MGDNPQINFEHTAPPWRWFVNLKSHQVYLGTPDRGRLFIMGFERWGMQGARPVFRDARLHCMFPFEHWCGEPDHNGVAELLHPDALLMARAPVLKAEVKRLREALEGVIRNDKTHYEHHAPRPFDGQMPEVVDTTATRWATPAEIARTILKETE